VGKTRLQGGKSFRKRRNYACQHGREAKTGRGERRGRTAAFPEKAKKKPDLKTPPILPGGGKGPYPMKESEGWGKREQSLSQRWELGAKKRRVGLLKGGEKRTVSARFSVTGGGVKGKGGRCLF